MGWFVYILECADKTLYTGITTDPERRLHEHNHTKAGARYTRVKRPVSLVYCENADDRSNAAKRECVIKKMTRKQKCLLIATAPYTELNV